MKENPLVSVICLCYNHQNYVVESIQSVLDQTYKNIELIIYDDASKDNSQSVIEDFIKDKPEITFLRGVENKGNCTSFNIAFERSSGEYIIDLAADDVLLPSRIEQGVNLLESAKPTYGVHYGNGILIDSESNHLKTERNDLPSGDLYVILIQKYFINPASMMMRRSVLENLEGYDEALTYEDFDFWIRSSRVTKYIASQDPLVKKRVLSDSLSGQQFRFGNRHMESTFRVCEKIKKLNRTEDENQALRKRIRYEMKLCLRYGNPFLFFRYLKLYFSLKID